MTKNNNPLNDIVPPGEAMPVRRSIRDIPINDRRENKIDELLAETAEFRSAQHASDEPTVPPPSSYNRQAPEPIDEEERIVPRTPFRRTPPSSYSSPRKAIWWIALVAVLVLAGAALIFFKSATIDVKIQTATVPVSVTATSASVISVQKEGTAEVSATGASVKVDKKASGTITVYNNYSADPQDLVATTRFQTADGLIYRIDKPITVPGTTVVNGKTIPGSIDAVVTADVSGDKYNISNADFTVPGFKGGPKYDFDLRRFLRHDAAGGRCRS